MNAFNIDNLENLSDAEQLELLAQLMQQVQTMRVHAEELDREVKHTRKMVVAAREEVLDLRDQIADYSIANGVCSTVLSDVYA